MPATTWKALRQPEAEREYLVLLTHLPMRRPSKLPRFLAYVRKIQKQLDRSEGLLGILAAGEAASAGLLDALGLAGQRGSGAVRAGLSPP